MPRTKRSRWRLGGFGAVLVLLLCLLPLALAEGPGRGKAEKDDRRPEDRRPGQFAEHDGQFVGRYVDFFFDRGSCTVADFRVAGREYFDMIDLRGPCEARVDPDGYRVEVEVGDSKLKLHDNPTGLVRLHASRDQPIRVWVEPNVAVAPGEEGELLLRAGPDKASLLLTSPWGAELELDEDRTLELRNKRATFLLRPPEAPAATAEPTKTPPLEPRSLGGQVDILRDEKGRIREEVLPVHDVVIARLASEPDVFRFVVDGQEAPVRSFAVNFAPGTLPSESLDLRFYGAEGEGWKEAPITPAANLSRFEAAPVVEVAQFWTESSDLGTRVVVLLPRFDSYLVEILAILASSPVLIFGALAGVGFVAWAARGLVRRPGGSSF